jgi:lipopolysaccharide biosynthesis regulator YciM
VDASTLVSLFGALAVAALLALAAVLSRKGRTEDEARAYLAGFKYVISDDPDAAIAELSKAAQLNRQTLETYFALGALFRRKGELDRAIRLHSNILLRPGLTPDIRRRAQLALALDHKRAGLRDKAIETFEKLLADEPGNREGLLGYRQVLEDSGEWAKAAEVQERLVKREGRGEEILAHLLAQQARAVLSQSPSDAEAIARRAVDRVPNSADGLLALAQARVALGRAADAREPVIRALQLEPELAPSGLRTLAAAMDGPEGVEQFLRDQMASGESPSAPCALALGLHLRSLGHLNRALEVLRPLVERSPHFWEARKQLGALLLAADRSEEMRVDYQEILGTLGQPSTAFVCGSCRQKLAEHAFRCPACQQWDSVERTAG